MELMFLYIVDYYSSIESLNEVKKGEPYKCIYKNGFNFSNDFRFVVEERENNFFLKISKRKGINNFYDPTGKICSLTGVIGKNGTGKSSLFDFIIGITKSDYNLKDIDFRFIAVYNTSNSNEESHCQVIYHPQINLFFHETVSSNLKSDFLLKRIDFEDSYTKYIPKYLLIKYSGVFEYNNPNPITSIGSTEYFKDISTSNIVSISSEVNHNQLNPHRDIFKEYRHAEIKKQALLIANNKLPENSDFRLPKFLKLTIDDFDIKALVNKARIDHKVLTHLQTLSETTTKFIKARGMMNSKEAYLDYLHLVALFNTIRKFSDGMISLPEKEILDLSAVNENFTGKITGIISYCFKQVGEERPMIVDFLANSTKFEAASYHAFPSFELFVEMNEKNFQFLNQYFNAKLISEFLIFDWTYSEKSSGELSSGEKSYLSLFARLYDIRHHFETYGTEMLENLIILFDEGDQYFHPEWQRKYIHRLTKFLPFIFDCTKTIQLIISSHSPFIASDLIREDIIFLSKNDDGITEVTELKKHEQTFGANIHSLFTDAFFMDNGLIGEFAKSKIENTIRELYSYREMPFSNERLIEISSAIEILGEPILRQKMLELYEECVGVKINETLEAKEKRLSDELKKVQEQINKRKAK